MAHGNPVSLFGRAEPNRDEFGPSFARFGDVLPQDALVVFFVLPEAALQQIGAQAAGIIGGEEVHEPAQHGADGVDPGERQFRQEPQQPYEHELIRFSVLFF